MQKNGDVNPAAEGILKFQQIGLELLDISLYYGEKGVDKVKSLPLYQKVDAVLNINDKFDLVRKHGENLYTYLDKSFKPLI